MKKTRIVLFALLGLGFTYSTSAQDTTVRNSLSVSPFEFFSHTFQLGYERMHNEMKNGFVINAGITASNLNEDKIFGMKSDVQYRFYFDKEHRNPERTSQITIFTGPFVAFKFLDREINDYYYPIIYDPNQPSYQEPVQFTRKDQINSFGGGVIVGMRLAMFNKINLDTYFGGGVKYSDYETNNLRDYYFDVTDPEYSGVFPKAGFTLGIRF